ncbi:hypothetical protein SCP_1000620 [Sparassis crispa]|uniref:Yeast cell wall synthesis Kre9/Knh1-like N-terminal domain-containing protein n=1 Tax=Sparassis crispa TaxID=139825 RepID=A0A401GXB6_9APHY|nr:hypothetical protein SCP_1000620 [Sparassis crispa]GBE86820.1 hypothetical protein SCP_1000620 [Sparassis crispa]
MHLLSLIPSSVLSILLAWCLVPIARANYFVVEEPTTGVQWVNGQNNLVTWTKALDDGIDVFDIELTRISVDGLKYIAQSVPASVNTVNVYIQDIPTADDYYLVFVNSTFGYLYAYSEKFAIANSSNGSSPTTNPSAHVVSISGAPNPTDNFATTFPASGAAPGWHGVTGSLPQLVGILSALLMCAMGGALTVL